MKNMNELQTKTAKAIVNIFETGKIHGDYGQVTLIRGDTGHLTYGRSQTTLASGNLHLLLDSYVEAEGEYSLEVEPYLTRTLNRDFSLDHDIDFHYILKEAGLDPIMKETQDLFFDRVYWNPAMNETDRMYLYNPLSKTVVYDSYIHGSWGRIRDTVIGTPGTRGEEAWIIEYIYKRKQWLANHTNTILHRTVYRMDSLRKIALNECWNLQLPLAVRGVMITEESLNEEYSSIVHTSAEGCTNRHLRFTDPIMRGADIKKLQTLMNVFIEKKLNVDGVFGRNTLKAVVRFQLSNCLKPDGIVGPVFWDKIEGKLPG